MEQKSGWFRESFLVFEDPLERGSCFKRFLLEKENFYRLCFGDLGSSHFSVAASCMVPRSGVWPFLVPAPHACFIAFLCHLSPSSTP